MRKVDCQRCGRIRYIDRMREQPPRWQNGHLVPSGTFVCEAGKRTCKIQAKKYRRSLRQSP